MSDEFWYNSSRMKKAFTLVELMVVVVVIVTLLAITFRLVSVGEDATYRNNTIARMQRLENALSGYFAAFGSYPPVGLHASRNVYARVNEQGVQQEGQEDGELVWANVNMACRAQPVAARFPFPDTSDVRTYLEAVSQIVIERVNSIDEQWKEYKDYSRQLGSGFTPVISPNQVSGWNSKKTWQEVKIFEFGVMSFLLPRYLFMSQGIDPDDLNDCAQWNANNRLSSHPNAGYHFENWKDQLDDVRLVRRIPSQSVCARWMPNFEKMVCANAFAHPGGLRFFGVDIHDDTYLGNAVDPDYPWDLAQSVYVDQDRTILDVMTVKDGWHREFYYYSPPPFQSYRLWSAGPNGKTFPPWMPFSSLKSDTDRKTAANWMADDIMYLSN